MFARLLHKKTISRLNLYMNLYEEVYLGVYRIKRKRGEFYNKIEFFRRNKLIGKCFVANKEVIYVKYGKEMKKLLKKVKEELIIKNFL